MSALHKQLLAELLPTDVWIAELTAVYESHIAAAHLIQLIGIDRPPHITPEQLARRQGITAIGARMMISDRDRRMSFLCHQWTLAHPPQPSGEVNDTPKEPHHLGG